MHVAKLAYCDDFNTVPDGGAQGAVGVAAVDVVARKYWMSIIGVVLMVTILLARPRIKLPEIPLRGFPTDCFRRVSSFLIDNVLLLVLIAAEG